MACYLIINPTPGSGSYLLSGGHECVLVKWHLDSNYKDFMPRLGAPINHVTCSRDNQLYSTCHTENGRFREENKELRFKVKFAVSF